MRISDWSSDVCSSDLWQRADKRSTIPSYQFPPQEPKLLEGAAVLHAPSLQKVGTILSRDSEAGTAEIKRGNAAKGAWPLAGSFIPEPTVPNAILVAAVRRVAMAWAGIDEQDLREDEVVPIACETSDGITGNVPYRALLSTFDREKPRIPNLDVAAVVRDEQSLFEAWT